MTISPQRWLSSLAVAGLIALPAVSLAQEGQYDTGSDSRQSDAQQSDSRQRDSQQRDSQQSGSQQQRDSQQSYRDSQQSNFDQSRDQTQDRDRNQQRWDQTSDREWAENSQYQDDDQAGLGVTLYERESGREGATVRRVHPNSPAEHMGLRVGDRITQINGDEVESHRDLIEEIRELQPGDTVRIEIQRDGEARTVQGELESRREALVFRGQRVRDRGPFFDRRARDERWDQGRDRVAFRDDRWDSGDRSSRRQYSYEGGSISESGPGRPQQSQQLHQQLDSLERQVNQLRTEIDRLRNSIGGRSSSQSQGYTRTDSSRDSQSQGYGYDRESQAGYSEYGEGQYGSRTSYNEPSDSQWSDGRGSGSGQQQYQETERSPGGQVGEERLRPGSDTPGGYRD